MSKEQTNRDQAVAVPLDLVNRDAAVHALIKKLCRAAGIDLILTQEGRSGHMEIAEIWTISAPLPLEEASARELDRLGIRLTEARAGGGIIYASRLMRSGGWTEYQLADPNQVFYKP